MLFDVKLAQIPSCADSGSHSDDQTVGDYVAGFLSSLDKDANLIEARCELTGRSADVHRCAFWMKHRDEDDEWAWGIDFIVMRNKPVRLSLRCIGSG